MAGVGRTWIRLRASWPAPLLSSAALIPRVTPLSYTPYLVASSGLKDLVSCMSGPPVLRALVGLLLAQQTLGRGMNK